MKELNDIFIYLHIEIYAYLVHAMKNSIERIYSLIVGSIVAAAAAVTHTISQN